MLSRRIQRVSSNAGTQSEQGAPNVPPRCKEFSERRRVMDQARSINVRRIQQEVQRIAQREVEYAQRLLSELTPVKLTVNESAWARWQEFLPIRLDVVTSDAASAAESATTATPTQTMEENSSDAPIA